LQLLSNSRAEQIMMVIHLLALCTLQVRGLTDLICQRIKIVRKRTFRVSIRWNLFFRMMFDQIKSSAHHQITYHQK